MNNLSGNGSASRAVVQLAWPLASVMLGETLMGLVDTKLVGGLGAAALGGVGLANAALYLTNIGMLGLMRGVKVCTAHAYGSGRPRDGRLYAWLGLGLGLVCGATFGVCLAHSAGMLRLMNIGPDLVPTAQAYLSARAWGLPAACALAALMEHRQGTGDVRTSLAIGLCGNAVNAFLAYCLIYGHVGFPALGVAGAGYGTVVTEYLQLATMLAVMLSGRVRGGVPTTLRLGAALRELLQVGVPTALHFGFEYLAFAACTAILAGISDADVAAHQITVVVNRLAYLPGLAIGEVACILVSNALGARHVEDAERAVRAALTTAVLFMVGVGVLLAVFGGALARLFTNDTLIAGLTARALLLAGLFQVVDAVNIVMRGALRGARDVRVAAVVGITVLWLCVPTLTLLLGRYAGWGVVGGWVSFFAQSAVCASVYTWRWRRGRWRQPFEVVTTVPAAVSALGLRAQSPA